MMSQTSIEPVVFTDIATSLVREMVRIQFLESAYMGVGLAL